MINLQTAAIFLAATTLLPSYVHSHGYLNTPRSRNFVAFEDGAHWSSDPSIPAKEVEPQSASPPGYTCGKIGSRDYNYPKNVAGAPLPVNQQACYEVNSVIDLGVTLTAHHKGHFEFYACPITSGEVPTQSCFDANPLTFISDTKTGAQLHPSYPERAYLAPSANDLEYKFQLPTDMVGDLVLLQWHYVTANSCKPPGYDDVDNPNTFSHHEGSCVPAGTADNAEQFWNCAEIKIVNDITTECGDTPIPGPSTPNPAGPTTPPPITPPTYNEYPPTPPPSPPPFVSTPKDGCASYSGTCGPSKTCAQAGYPGMCCSQWGYCGNGLDYCNACCQDGTGPNCDTSGNGTPPSPTPPTGSPPTGTGSLIEYDATHGEDSRMIAYVGNWQSCPTVAQTNAYSHIVIAFAVSYMYNAAKNQCDGSCAVSTDPVPICANSNNEALVDSWRAAGKKVILSFGGAGMGGSWFGDPNNCWDDCFGEDKTEALATSLVEIVDKQNFDGIDIDYEYCYDIGGKQAGRCSQRTANYSDEAAKTFLNDITSKLRTKLDALQAINGYDRGRYELTHAPMDSDLTLDSEYFKILQDRRADLDFLMPQFYNGVTRPAVDGVDGFGAGQFRAIDMYSDLANVMFEGEPEKVVFGHCIDSCGGTGSNAMSGAAVEVHKDLKTYNNGEFECNGGAFFWVAEDDAGGLWSDAVVEEVSKTAGCSSGVVATTTQAPPTTSEATTQATTTLATTQAPPTTSEATTQATTTLATTQATTTTSEATTQATTTLATTQATTTTSEATTQAPPTTTQEPGTLIENQEPRCGTSEIDAREHCKPTCTSNADCGGEWCWGVHKNFCGSFPQRTYSNPVQGTIWARCGLTEVHARTFCGTPCNNYLDCEAGEQCHSIHSNYCGSDYVTDDGPVTTAAPPTTSEATTQATTQAPPTTTEATTSTTTTTTTTTSSTQGELIISTANRCGATEMKARELCGQVCSSSADCTEPGQWCYSVHKNYCDSIPKRIYDNPVQSSVWNRCAPSDMDYATGETYARTFCTEPCGMWPNPCTALGMTCRSVQGNYCGSDYTEV